VCEETNLKERGECHSLPSITKQRIYKLELEAKQISFTSLNKKETFFLKKQNLINSELCTTCAKNTTPNQDSLQDNHKYRSLRLSIQPSSITTS
jgi:hypothetical protein